MAPSSISNSRPQPNVSRPPDTISAPTNTTVNSTNATERVHRDTNINNRFEVNPTQPSAAAMPLVRRPSTPAENYMQPLEHGFWKDPKAVGGHTSIRGYIDFAVQNYEFHKQMAVKMTVTRENGAVEEFIYRPRYKGKLPDGKERWGTDSLQLFPDAGSHGKIKHVDISYIVQADVDGDRQRDLCTSRQSYRIASYDDLQKPKANMGRPSPVGENPDFGLHEIDTSGMRGTSLAYKDNVPPIEVYFAPYDNPERAVMAEIDKVITAKREDPDGHHYIYASVFNINDPRIVDKLIEAHRNGVDVKLLTAAHQMTPDKTWQTEYPRLQQAGIPVIGMVRDQEFASNHTKFAVFDGKAVTTGSYNWETRSAEDNNENMMILRSPEVAAQYLEMFRAIGGGPQIDRPVDPSSKLNIYYSQQHDVPKVICQELDRAEKDITVSMFTLRTLKDNDGQDVLDALVRAKQRGVNVTVVLEKNIADAGEYYGRTTPNDLTDERLAEHGIEIVKIHTNYNNNKYAAMHHKFAVIDGETTLTGPYNWYSGSKVSDDDLVLVRDKTVANRYLGEVNNLRHHYDTDFDPKSVPQTRVDFAINNPHTKVGDQVYLVGNIPELGNWDLSKAIRLDPSEWPKWKASVEIPSGTHFEYKLLVRNFYGNFWEPGSNREHTANPDGDKDAVQTRYR
jgi:phosphatidylserine/phosphatidylglycerophosphate/cardiolipin synthase-like enzyme